MTTEQIAEAPKRQRRKAAEANEVLPSAAKPKPTESKKARLQALLARPKGATLAQLEQDLGWQPHTVRAAISGLRKGGAEVTLDRDGKVPSYRITAPTSAEPSA